MAERNIAMKALLIFVAALQFQLFFIQPLMAQRTVWYSDDLQKLEVQSLYELIKIISGETFATSDDATIQLSAHSSSGFKFRRSSLYLNDVPLYIQNWNTLSFHTIPVSVEQIDSVVISENYAFDRSALNVENISIYIYSISSEEGLHLTANTVTGNRSGDPGPFVYTELASRNIERLGPVSDASLSYRKKEFQLWAGIKQFVHAITDPLQFRRLTPYEFGSGLYRHEKIRSNSAFLTSAFKTGFFQHNVQAGLTKTEDFIFTELYGTEIPVHRKWYFISATGNATLNKKFNLHYLLSKNSTRLKEYPNKEDKWLRWDQKVFTGKITLKYDFSDGSQSAGFIAQKYDLNSQIKNTGTLTNTILNLYHRLYYSVNNALNIHSNLQIALNGTHAIKGGGGVEFKLDKQHRLKIDAIYDERLPAEDNNLWYWISDKGYASDTLSQLISGSLPEKSSLKQSSITWRSNMNTVDIEFSAIFSRIENDYGADYDLIPAGQRIQTGSIYLRTDLNASFFQFPVKAEFEITPKLRQTIHYTWSKNINGSVGFHEQMPEHHLMTNLNWLPVQSFKLWVRLQTLSSIYWPEVRGIDGLEVRINPLQKDYYLAETKSRFLLDFGIRKYFWNNRLSFILNMENISNQTYRNHPVSPEHAFTVFFGMHLSL